MSETSTWTAKISGTGNTELVSLFQGGVPLTFGQLFELLQDHSDFATWYTCQLKRSRFASYFWEHPPLTRTTIDSNAEFVLVNAPMLDNLHPNPAPFRPYFAAGEVVTFRNLGGDAILIAPSPADASQGYAHLSAFLHRAPDSQVHVLWHDVGQAICKSLTDKPIWLSTSGLGVAWLHIRLDSTPKYYQHQPYKMPPPADD
jgi:hypothetical protein